MHAIHSHTDNGNTTVMNETGCWSLVRAPSDPRWREEYLGLPNRGEALCSLQTRQHSSGLTRVAPEWCIRGEGYWYLRNTSNLGDSHPAGYGRYDSLPEALEAAILWWERDPSRREVICSTRSAALLFLDDKVRDPYMLRKELGLS